MPTTARQTTAVIWDIPSVEDFEKPVLQPMPILDGDVELVAFDDVGIANWTEETVDLEED